MNHEDFASQFCCLVGTWESLTVDLEDATQELAESTAANHSESANTNRMWEPMDIENWVRVTVQSANQMAIELSDAGSASQVCLDARGCVYRQHNKN